MRNATFAKFLTLGLTLGITLGLPAQAAGPVPRPSKEFTVTTPQGQQILLSSEKGKVVVVQFLFTWCPHCQAFSQLLTQMSMEYGPRGFQALGVAFDDDDGKMPLKDKAAAYSKQYAGFPVGFSTRSTVLSYLGISELERIGVPEVVVLDRKGVIREQSPSQGGGQLTDPAHLKGLIETLLAEGGGTKAPAKSGDSTKPAEKKTSDKKPSE